MDELHLFLGSQPLSVVPSAEPVDGDIHIASVEGFGCSQRRASYSTAVIHDAIQGRAVVTYRADNQSYDVGDIQENVFQQSTNAHQVQIPKPRRHQECSWNLFRRDNLCSRLNGKCRVLHLWRVRVSKSPCSSIGRMILSTFERRLPGKRNGSDLY